MNYVFVILLNKKRMKDLKIFLYRNLQCEQLNMNIDYFKIFLVSKYRSEF